MGRDEAIGGAKIEPLERDEGLGEGTVSTGGGPGLDDEVVSGRRIEPGGEVREELS